MADWVRWHEERYAHPGTELSERLRTVQGLIRSFLDDRAGDLRVLSLCAGDGRDLLGVLEEDEARSRVRARLVERDEALAGAARARASAAGLVAEVLQADAGNTDTAAGFAPADLALACGIFGNVPDEDVERTVRALPSLLSERGAVIWTRGRRAPDLTPSIRAWFADAGFAESAFESPGPDSFAVGMHELVDSPAPFEPGRRLFTFYR